MSKLKMQCIPIGTAGELVSRNVTINGRRTSLRLEPAMWDALAEIAKREGTALNEVIAGIDRTHRGPGLTTRVRVFALGYFRAAATEAGHQRVGHGVFYRGWGDRAERGSDAHGPGHSPV